MNLEQESYLQKYRRHEQLAGLKDRWQLLDLVRSQEKRPLLYKVRTWLQLLAQVRRIRIQVSFEISEPCPEGVTR
jgi:hypothetical protein